MILGLREERMILGDLHRRTFFHVCRRGRSSESDLLTDRIISTLPPVPVRACVALAQWRIVSLFPFDMFFPRITRVNQLGSTLTFGAEPLGSASRTSSSLLHSGFFRNSQNSSGAP